MTLTSKTVNNFGYISITIMMALLLLLWFKIVPGTWTVPFFVVSLGLFLARLVLRFRLAKLERKELQAKKQEPAVARTSSSDNQ